MVHETVDGEVIVIDLATGAYYNLPGAASEIWQSIALGGSREDMIARVAERYGEDPTSIEVDIDNFVAQLLEEELVVVSEAEIVGSVAVGGSDDPPAKPFTKPVLEQYTDMAELILLDPVHDVSALGWPDQTGAPSSKT